MTTVAVASSPSPVILYKGTPLKEPSEYPTPTFVVESEFIGDPTFSITPVGPVVAPSLTFLPTTKFESVVPVIITLNFRGKVVIAFGNSLCVCAFLFPSFGL